METFVNDNRSIAPKVVRSVLGIRIVSCLIGGALGFLFYYLTSCCSDDMPLSLNPYLTVIYGIITGALLSTKH